MHPSPLPQEFLRRLEQLTGSDSQQVLDAFAAARPTTFRINSLKGNAQEVLGELMGRGFSVRPVPWYPEAYLVETGVLRDLTQTDSYTQGKLYVQSLSSMIPALVLNPKPGSRVLDMAAAPGSKTTQMAAMMQNDGTIVANDTSRVRSFRLKANLDMQGVRIATTSAFDGRAIWQRHPEAFDYVLADVPCSMEGRFQSDDPKSYADWSLKKVKDLSHLQRWMLRSAISATKPGGTIVYSTCTLSPEENEEVIDWILDKEHGNVVLEELRLPGFAFRPAVLRWGGRSYDASVGRTARIYPTPEMEGFYVAKLKKLKSSVPRGLRQ